jgi:pimeloyl-ACP methyl ester carboxylesterase
MIVYIHGASATSESFNYVKEHIGGEDYCVNYDSRNGFENNLADIHDQIKNFTNIFFICHSLGGIYALHLSNMLENQVVGAVTLSTPYGGAEIADVAKFFLPYSRLLRDVGPNSWAMKRANNIAITHPWLNIVTVKGNALWVPQPNDGVVTIASQKHHNKDMDLIDLEYNHYEVLLSDKTVKIIKERLNA